MKPHIISDPGFWAECWKQARWSFSSLVRRTQHPSFSQKIQEFKSVTTGQFSIFKWPPAQRGQQRFWIMFTYGFFLVWYTFNLHLCNRETVNRKQQTVFIDIDFWKCSWAHAVVSMTESYLFSMLCHLKARRSRASNIDFFAAPLVHWDA